MGTIPTPPTFVAGAVLTAAGLNSLRDVLNFWAGPPQCYAWRSGSQSIPNSTDTAVQLNAETFDIVQSGDSPMHDNTTSNTRLVCRTPGKYEMTGAIRFDISATGVRQAGIRLNGTTFLIKNQQVPPSGATTDTATPTIIVSMSAGDYIELIATQSSGGALNIVGAQEVTFLRMRLIST